MVSFGLGVPCTILKRKMFRCLPSGIARRLHVPDPTHVAGRRETGRCVTGFALRSSCEASEFSPSCVSFLVPLSPSQTATQRRPPPRPTPAPWRRSTWATRTSRRWGASTPRPSSSTSRTSARWAPRPRSARSSESTSGSSSQVREQLLLCKARGMRLSSFAEPGFGWAVRQKAQLESTTVPFMPTCPVKAGIPVPD